VLDFSSTQINFKNFRYLHCRRATATLFFAATALGF
jgi:hypothetical protein